MRQRSIDGIRKFNFVQLSPLSFLERSAQVHPSLPSVLYEDRRFTWAETGRVFLAAYSETL